MTVQECYLKMGGNYDDARARLAMDRLIEKFMLKFPNDPTMENLRKGVAEENHDDTFRAAHTLKGVAANLAFTELQKAASDLTEQLRNNQEKPDPALLAAVEASYAKTIEVLNAYAAEKA